jgi:hypothetical protein
MASLCRFYSNFAQKMLRPMHTKMLLPLYAFLLCAACASQATMQAQPMPTSNLLRDLKAEGCCGKNFVPSPTLVKKYNLYQDGNIYYVGGFLHVEQQFQLPDNNNFSIKIGAQLDSLWTVQIPIQNLEPLLKTKGVKTFEVGKKAQPKKMIMNNRQ